MQPAWTIGTIQSDALHLGRGFAAIKRVVFAGHERRHRPAPHDQEPGLQLRPPKKREAAGEGLILWAWPRRLPVASRPGANPQREANSSSRSWQSSRWRRVRPARHADHDPAGGWRPCNFPIDRATIWWRHGRRQIGRQHDRMLWTRLRARSTDVHVGRRNTTPIAWRRSTRCDRVGGQRRCDAAPVAGRRPAWCDRVRGYARRRPNLWWWSAWRNRMRRPRIGWSPDAKRRWWLTSCQRCDQS
jgi:hypothetical protein